MRVALNLCDLPFKNPYNQSNLEGKKSDEYQLRDILQNALPVILKIIKVIENKKKFEKLL